MKKYFNSSIGRLRTLAFLEGISLLILVLIGVPMKHMFENAMVVKVFGPIHGALFVFYVINTFSVASELDWPFFKTTFKVLIASFIPFGTFYVDHKILAPAHKAKTVD